MAFWYNWCVRCSEEAEDTVRFRGEPPNNASLAQLDRALGFDPRG